MVLGDDDKLFLYQPLNNQMSEIETAIRLTTPDGGTALWDALAGATRRLVPLKDKRAIILLSDGDDTDSEFTDAQVRDHLQRSGVIVYTVGTTAQMRREENLHTIEVMRNMAEFSGGQAYFPSYISHLQQIYAAIGQDLNSQYKLGYYTSLNACRGAWRSLTVCIKGKVRHRNGYYAN